MTRSRVEFTRSRVRHDQDHDLKGLLLVVSFMDRVNIAFAALTMNKDIPGLSAAAYGMSLTVFYIAYTLFEIPSNLILAKVGARLWIARIMITWGLASAATMFAVGML